MDTDIPYTVDAEDYEECPTCDGTGKAHYSYDDEYAKTVSCSDCGGHGVVPRSRFS